MTVTSAVMAKLVITVSPTFFVNHVPQEEAEHGHGHHQDQRDRGDRQRSAVIAGARSTTDADQWRCGRGRRRRLGRGSGGGSGRAAWAAAGAGLLAIAVGAARPIKSAAVSAARRRSIRKDTWIGLRKWWERGRSKSACEKGNACFSLRNP